MEGAYTQRANEHHELRGQRKKSGNCSFPGKEATLAALFRDAATLALAAGGRIAVACLTNSYEYPQLLYPAPYPRINGWDERAWFD